MCPEESSSVGHTGQTLPDCARAPGRDGKFRVRKKGLPDILLVCAFTQDFFKEGFVLCPLK